MSAAPDAATAGELLAAARSVAERAHAPYSRFRVGAIAVVPDGTRFEGANVENAAFPATSCAEANAVAAAVTAGHRSIITVAVGCLDTDECVPCGRCRQIMREFGVRHVVVQLDAETTEVLTLEELLPRSFGPEALPG